ncbi:MAG: regulatory protein RecX [Candidatus Poribacteria bacterium]|nr:regulatory protein RecX [Candidatus Poribacteria bacterium]
MASETVTIIGVHHIPRRSNMRQIELAQGDSFGLSVSVVTRHGLRVGMTLTAERLTVLRTEDARVRAKEAALNFLRLRDYAAGEMIERLKRKGFDEDAAAHAVESLKTLGLISDEAVAKEHVRSRLRSKPKGRIALRRELFRKGISRDTIERALITMDDRDERDAALRAARQQLPRYQTLTVEVRHRRLYHFLLRRGFTYETVASVLKEVLTGNKRT